MAKIKTCIVKINPVRSQADKIRKIAKSLKNGKLVVFPTETVYGIAANTKNKNAMSRLRRLKNRPSGPFSFHIASETDLKRLGCVVDGLAKKLIQKFWPGPLTLLFNTKSGKKIGVRMPRHPVALALLKEAAVTVVAPSANFKNKKPAVDAKQAMEDLKGFVDIIIDAGRVKIGISSTVLDLTKTPPEILREGSVSKERIKKAIG